MARRSKENHQKWRINWWRYPFINSLFTTPTQPCGFVEHDRLYCSNFGGHWFYTQLNPNKACNKIKIARRSLLLVLLEVGLSFPKIKFALRSLFKCLTSSLSKTFSNDSWHCRNRPWNHLACIIRNDKGELERIVPQIQL